jgi:pimeloyl-ACP methyl ester carboxylesterase
VVLVAGGGDFSFDWELVQAKVAAFTRVCSYDRAGEAWSDPGPMPRTMRQEVHELHALLVKAGCKGPFVLVGQSLGGLVVRLYAEAYPRDLAGVVLVDPTHESTRLSYRGKLVRMREQARGKPIPPVQTIHTSPPRPSSAAELKEAEKWAKAFGPPTIRSPYDQEPVAVQKLRLWFLAHPKHVARGEDFWAEELQQMYEARQKNAQPLSDLPLIVLAAGKKPEKAPPEVSEEEWKQLLEEKRRQREDQATLSRNSVLIFDKKSGHHIHLDNPDLVVQAVREVIGAVAERRKVKVPVAGGL